jgi:two-component system sensor histidine kinase RegB
MREPLTTSQIGLAWLVRLRWGAAVGQGIVLGLAWATLDPLPMVPLVVLVLATFASNVVLARLARRDQIAPRLVFGALVFDALLLTGLLLGTGGPSNPFTVFYLVEVALSATLLDARRAWALAGLTSACFGALFLLPSHAIDEHAHHASKMHLQGMWVAFTLAAGFVAHFVSRVSDALRRREAQVLELRELAGRAEKLASLSTLAAGAAHELGTPLGTIAIAAKELERALEARAEKLDDVRLIRTEVDRCRAVLRRMAAQMGEGTGEMPRDVALSEVGEKVRAALDADAEWLRVEADAGAIVAPVEALAQVLVNLVRNGIDAQRAAGVREPVVLRMKLEGSMVKLSVEDHGKGLSPEARARACEPFFTTKPEGEGMGLGLFLVRAFADKLGGSLALAPRNGGGTEARVVLPRDVLARPA